MRSIGKIMPEILFRYGLSLDVSDARQPQPPATVFVPIAPRSQSMLEPVAVGNVLDGCQ
jgi:hypothetical protein